MHLLFNLKVLFVSSVFWYLIEDLLHHYLHVIDFRFYLRLLRVVMLAFHASVSIRNKVWQEEKTYPVVVQYFYVLPGTTSHALGSSHLETFWWSLRRKVEIQQKSVSRDEKPQVYVLSLLRITLPLNLNLGMKMDT